MLPEMLLDAVRHLLAQGLSHRRIADALSISRGTVLAVAQGRREDRDDPRRKSDQIPPAPTEKSCPGCAATPHPPCRVCRARAGLLQRRRRHADPREDWVGEPPRLNLRGECRRRYEILHAEKLRRGEDPIDEDHPNESHPGENR